ncbi:carboxypeptidase-like regulatory domain-containing protein, partial [Pseudomonas aeruginosa]|uniref:carboxypeptidase-like regulatory domain-containing protein n=1 Tax=Pseudomonas aeruginosa TaxID=287 RepID=UPI002884DAB0
KTAIAGATVLAYDDTANVNNPTASLPLSRAVTSSTGAYVLTGLKAGDIYTVFVNAPGYFVVNQSTLTVAGNRPGFDFALKPKPLDVD